MSLWISSTVVSFGLSTILATAPLSDQNVSRSLIVGNGSGLSLTDGRCNIIIGDNIDVPDPHTSFYINVDGVEYPPAARHDPDFQMLVKKRADELAKQLIGENYKIDVEPFFRECDPPIAAS